MSMNFNDYWYIYQDSLGYWSTAKNPVFIAEHKKCQAILKESCSDIELKKHLEELNK